MIALDLFGKRFHAMFVCVSIPHFVVWIIWPKFIRREYRLLINSKISFMMSGDMSILTEPHSQILSDFDVFQILLKLHFYAKIVPSK